MSPPEHAPEHEEPRRPLAAVREVLARLVPGRGARTAATQAAEFDAAARNAYQSALKLETAAPLGPAPPAARSAGAPASGDRAITDDHRDAVDSQRGCPGSGPPSRQAPRPDASGSWPGTSRTTSASTARQPCGRAITGLQSTSVISGRSGPRRPRATSSATTWRIRAQIRRTRAPCRCSSACGAPTRPLAEPRRPPHRAHHSARCP
jgi:hypothetical protein